MDRRTICLVAALAVLGGCLGGAGGSDATPTTAPTATTTPQQTATPTPTPAASTPTPTPTPTDPPATATLVVDETGFANLTAVQGQEVPIQPRINNTGNASGTQTVSLVSGNETLGTAEVSVGADANAIIRVGTIDTTGLAAGDHEFTIRTDNDSFTFTVVVRDDDPYGSLLQRVENRTEVAQHTRYLSYDHPEVEFSPDRNDTMYRRYLQSETLPVPEATALAMADHPDPPEQVFLRVVNESAVRWAGNLTRSLAEGYANGSINISQFRTELYGAGVGEISPWFVAASDRGRLAYARDLAARFENDQFNESLSVADYGLYNETVELPDGDVLGPQTGIYLEFEVPETGTEVMYRNLSTTTHGMYDIAAIYKWGNLSDSTTHGGYPSFVNLRFVNETGTLYLEQDLPALWAQNVVYDDEVSLTEVQIVLDRMMSTRYYGGAEFES